MLINRSALKRKLKEHNIRVTKELLIELENILHNRIKELISRSAKKEKQEKVKVTTNHLKIALQSPREKNKSLIDKAREIAQSEISSRKAPVSDSPIPIDTLPNLSNRTRNALKRAKIFTLQDLKSAKMKKIKGIGAKCLAELKQYISEE